MEIKFVDDSIEDFIKSLEPQTISKVLRTLDLLEEFGHRLGMPHTKKIDGAILELRIIGKQNVRFLYAYHKKAIVVLHCFIKKTQKMPVRELHTAIAKYNRLI